jgi:hypothetical protein
MSNLKEENFSLVKTIDHILTHNDNFEENKDNLSIVSELLHINNPLHSSIIKKLNTLTIQSIIKEIPPLGDPNQKKRIKYKSKVDAENLDNIVNMSIWKNIPNVNTLFSNFESKKNSLVKSNLNNSYVNNNNCNKYNNKSKQMTDKRISDEDDDDSGSSQHNTYMSNSYYLKRKKYVNSF